MLKGSVPILYSLSNDEDVMTLRYVACTLVRLSVDEVQCHGRMIREGAVRYSVREVSMQISLMKSTLRQRRKEKCVKSREVGETREDTCLVRYLLGKSWIVAVLAQRTFKASLPSCRAPSCNDTARVVQKVDI